MKIWRVNDIYTKSFQTHSKYHIIRRVNGWTLAVLDEKLHNRQREYHAKKWNGQVILKKWHFILYKFIGLLSSDYQGGQGKILPTEQLFRNILSNLHCWHNMLLKQETSTIRYLFLSRQHFQLKIQKFTTTQLSLFLNII